MIREIIIPQRLKKRIKDKKRFPAAVRNQFIERLKQLLANDKHPSLRHKPIQGTRNFWEFSINMNYRCVYRRQGAVAYILAIGKHDDIF